MADNSPVDDDAEEDGSKRGLVIALVVLLLVAVGGWWLAQHLRAANRMQDCVMAGRTNCAPVR